MARGGTFKAGGVRWWPRAGADLRAVKRAVENTLDAMARGETRNVKSGRRKQLFPLRLDGGTDPDHLLKINRYPKGWHPLREIRGSKSRAELRRAEQTAARGVPTPVPLAAGERRVGGRLERCFLLSAVEPETLDLRVLWFRERPGGTERRALLLELGRFTREVQDAGIFQEDYAPNNILVRRGEKPEFLLIDFERARVRRRLRASERNLMLAKLERAIFDASAADRMRFLRGYAGGEARQWWRKLETSVGALAERDLARMGRASTRRGRRFSPVQLHGWSGYTRRSVDTAEMIRAAEHCGESMIQVQPGRWVVRYAQSDTATVWSVANTLWSRRLIARPLAILKHERGTYLMLERPPGSDRPLAVEPLTVLFDRLMTLGEPIPQLDVDDVAILPQRGGRRAVWLRPGDVHFGSRGEPERHRRARAAASQLVRVFEARERRGGSAPKG